MDFTSHESILREKVILALHGTPSLPMALEAARAPLLELTPADYVGLCLITTDPVVDFRWVSPGPRVALLDAKASWLDSDFVRAPSSAQETVVLRNEQRLPPGELKGTGEDSPSSALDPSQEHVMTVLIPVLPNLLGAFTFYRDHRRPFSDRDAAMVSSFTRHLANAIRNSHELRAVATSARMLEALYDMTDSAYLVVTPGAHEVARSPRATALLEKWFTPSDFNLRGLPNVLQERLEALVGMDAAARAASNPWISLHGDAYRVVRFVELTEAEGPRQWALTLHEIPVSIPLPETLRLELTPRQIDIAKAMLRNWSNEQIATELVLSEDTVKTHVRDIFKRLGTDNRTDFLYQAARLSKPV